MEYEIMLFVNTMSALCIFLIAGYHLIGKSINLKIGVKDEYSEYKRLWLSWISIWLDNINVNIRFI